MDNVNNRSIKPASFSNEYADEESDEETLDVRINVLGSRAANSRRDPSSGNRESHFESRNRNTQSGQKNANTMHDMGRGSSLKGRGNRHGD